MENNENLAFGDPEARAEPGRPREYLPWMQRLRWSNAGLKIAHEPEGISSKSTDFGDVNILKQIQKIANESWRSKFDEQPYSSFFMVSWLSWLSSTTMEELWQNPRNLNTFAVTSDQLDKDVMDALTRSCGRCTTFTIQVAHDLEDRQDLREIKDLPRLQWEYHDMSRHRLARCKNTGLVIHSSSPKGFLTVPPGETLEVVGEYPSAEKLSYTDEGISKLKKLKEREIKALKSSDGWITERESMRICLNELAKEKDLKPLCYFRHTFDSSDGMGAKFDGMIIFLLQDKQLQLRSSNRDVRTTFQWYQTSKDKDNAINTRFFTYKEHDRYRGVSYHTILTDFIIQFGGPHARKQWQCCWQDFGRFWSAACDLWGLPGVRRTDYGLDLDTTCMEILHNCWIATRTDQDLDGNEP